MPSVITLSLEAIAKTAPEVAFVHSYPGSVQTPLMKGITGWIGVLVRAVMSVLGRWLLVPIEESGERHLYEVTSGVFAAREGGAGGEVIGEGVELAKGSDGRVGSGVYSIGWDCEGGEAKTLELLEGYRRNGMADLVWRHTKDEFERIEKENAGRN